MELGEGLLGWAMSVAFVALSVGLALSLARLVLGPSLPDRVIALDNAAYQTIGFIIVYGLAIGQPELIDAALVLAAVAFLSTVAVARSVLVGAAPRRRDDDPPPGNPD